MKNMACAKALVLLLFLFGCESPEQVRAKFVTKGDQLFAAGEFEKARLEYLNALKIEANDAAARFGAGKSFDRLGSFPQAAGHYLAAAEADPTHLDSRLALARLFVLSASKDRAQRYIGEVLQIAPQHLDGKALQASLLTMQGKGGEALALAAEVVAQDPTNAYAVPLLTSIYMGQDQTAKARQVITRAIAANPQDVGLHGVNAQVLWELGDEEGYLSEMALLIELEPAVPAHVLNYAQALIRVNREEDALNVLQDHALRDSAPLDVQAAYLARLSTTSPTSAVASLPALLQSAADPDGLRMLQAEAHVRLGQVLEAQELFQQVATNESAKYALDAEVGLIGLRSLSGEVAAPREDLAKLLQDNPTNVRALLLATNLDVRSGEFERAISSVRLLLRDNPEEVSYYKRLGGIYQQNKQFRLAKDTYAQGLVRAPQDLELAAQFYELALQLGENLQAREVTERLLERTPNDLRVLSAHFRSYLNEGDFQRALDVARQVRTVAPDRGTGAYFEALAHNGLKDPQAAEASLRNSLRLQPGAVEPLSTLIRFLVAGKRQDEALSVLETQAKSSKSPYIRKYQADVMASQGQLNAAIEVYRALVDAEPDFVPGYRSLARLLSLQKNHAQALAMLQRGLQRNEDQSLYTDYALALQNDGQFDQAIAVYRRGLGKFPDDLAMANNLAMLLAEYRDTPSNLEEAKRLVVGLDEQENPAYLDTFGWVYYKRGEYAPAVQALRKATERAPESPLVRYHLAKALIGSGDAERALEQLRLATAGQQPFAGRDDALALVAKLNNG